MRERFSFMAALCVVLGLAACGAGIGTPETVSLPIPFAGALDGGNAVRVSTSSGAPLNTGLSQKLSNTIKSASSLQVSSFPMLNSKGDPTAKSSGFVAMTISSKTEPITTGDKTRYAMDIALYYQDGLIVGVEQMQFMEYPYPDFSGRNRLLRKGYAGGRITSIQGPTQLQDQMNTLKGQVVDHRYIYEVDANGTILGHEQSSWIIGKFPGQDA